MTHDAEIAFLTVLLERAQTASAAGDEATAKRRLAEAHVVMGLIGLREMEAE